MGVDFRFGIWQAVLEAVSTQPFAQYTYTDKERFVSVGSVVYGIYFIVGIPKFFFAIDEPSDNPRATEQPRKSTVYEVALNSLTATVIVTLLLDLWRMYLGNIYALGRPAPLVPFIYQSVPSRTLFQRIKDRVVDSSIRMRYNAATMIQHYNQILCDD